MGEEQVAATMFTFLFWVQLSLAVVEDRNMTGMSERKGKQALGVFTVVRFPNVLCSSNTSGRNGTCYTSSECTAKGGTSSGSCAQSFGVCCVFEQTCGSSTSENCTYFLSTDRSLGTTCSLTVCKSSSSVCQIRLDFESFVLSNPVTVTTITIGPASTGAGSGNSLGECQTDTFAVSSPCGKAPPVIGGTNTGEHMYIPACDQCNVLTSTFGSSSTATTSAFSIKVTMVECSSKLKAPEGCTQYFTGSTGDIMTYNYQSGSGVLLYNQDYCSCIRSARTTCSICFYSTAFKLSVPNGIAAIGLLGFDTVCGVLGIVAPYTNGGGFDYITIPDGQCDYPSTTTPAIATDTADRYCGTSFKCAQALNPAAIAGPASTVCTNQKPFRICVHSDNVEYANPAPVGEGTLANNRGFKISYYQKSLCQTRPLA